MGDLVVAITEIGQVFMGVTAILNQHQKKEAVRGAAVHWMICKLILTQTAYDSAGPAASTFIAVKYQRSELLQAGYHK